MIDGDQSGAETLDSPRSYVVRRTVVRRVRLISSIKPECASCRPYRVRPLACQGRAPAARTLRRQRDHPACAGQDPTGGTASTSGTTGTTGMEPRGQRVPMRKGEREPSSQGQWNVAVFTRAVCQDSIDEALIIEESSEMTSASTGSASGRIPVHGEHDSHSIPPKQKQSVIPSRNDCSCTVGSLIGSPVIEGARRREPAGGADTTRPYGSTPC